MIIIFVCQNSHLSMENLIVRGNLSRIWIHWQIVFEWIWASSQPVATFHRWTIAHMKNRAYEKTHLSPSRRTHHYFCGVTPFSGFPTGCNTAGSWSLQGIARRSSGSGTPSLFTWPWSSEVSANPSDGSWIARRSNGSWTSAPRGKKELVV